MAEDYDMDAYKRNLKGLSPQTLKKRADEICRNGKPENGPRKQMLDAVNEELQSRPPEKGVLRELRSQHSS